MTTNITQSKTYTQNVCFGDTRRLIFMNKKNVGYEILTLYICYYLGVSWGQEFKSRENAQPVEEIIAVSINDKTGK